MSILIAYKQGDVVYMGTDTRVTKCGTKFNDLCPLNHKIQKMPNQMLVGIATDKKVRQTLFANPDIFSLDVDGQLTAKHIVTTIIPKIQQTLKKHDLLIETEGKPPVMPGEILLAYKDKLYEICWQFSVYCSQDRLAVSSCPVADYAQYALFNAKEGDHPNQTIVKCLDVVAQNSHLVGRPYILIDTKDQNYSIVGGAQ